MRVLALIALLGACTIAVHVPPCPAPASSPRPPWKVPQVGAAPLGEDTQTCNVLMLPSITCFGDEWPVLDGCRWHCAPMPAWLREMNAKWGATGQLLRAVY